MRMNNIRFCLCLVGFLSGITLLATTGCIDSTPEQVMDEKKWSSAEVEKIIKIDLFATMYIAKPDGNTTCYVVRAPEAAAIYCFKKNPLL